MARSFGNNEIESRGFQLPEIGRSLRSSFRGLSSRFRSNSELSSRTNVDLDEEALMQWAAIDRLPTLDRLRSSLFEEVNGVENGNNGRKVVDVAKLSAPEKHMLIEKLIKHIENDNLRLLHKMRKRMDRSEFSFFWLQTK